MKKDGQYVLLAEDEYNRLKVRKYKVGRKVHENCMLVERTLRPLAARGSVGMRCGVQGWLVG